MSWYPPVAIPLTPIETPFVGPVPSTTLLTPTFCVLCSVVIVLTFKPILAWLYVANSVPIVNFAEVCGAVDVPKMALPEESILNWANVTKDAVSSNVVKKNFTFIVVDFNWLYFYILRSNQSTPDYFFEGKNQSNSISL
jgi:hypothetical protein